jgi:hypothetical protein
VGINTAIISRTGAYNGYGFAIPSNIVQKVIRDLREFGSVQWKFHSILTHLFHCKLTQVFHSKVTHLFHCKLTHP